MPKPNTQPDMTMKGNISVQPWLRARVILIWWITVFQFSRTTTAEVIHMPKIRAFIAVMPMPSWNTAVRIMTRIMGSTAFQKEGISISPKSLLAPYSSASSVV